MRGRGGGRCYGAGGAHRLGQPMSSPEGAGAGPAGRPVPGVRARPPCPAAAVRAARCAHTDGLIVGSLTFDMRKDSTPAGCAGRMMPSLPGRAGGTLEKRTRPT